MFVLDRPRKDHTPPRLVIDDQARVQPSKDCLSASSQMGHSRFGSECLIGSHVLCDFALVDLSLDQTPLYD